MNEPKYELINIIIGIREDGESWFEKIFDFIESEIPECTLEETGHCQCIQLGGGMTGTLDQIYDHERVSEKWAVDVLADDLKIALDAACGAVMPDDVYDRLRKAAYFHEDLQGWLDSNSEEK